MEELTAEQFKAAAAKAKRRRRSGPTPAAVLTRDCLRLLALHGVLAWRSNNVGLWDPTAKRFRSFQGMKGVADILGIVPPSGRLLAVEVKAGRDRLSKDQVAFLANINAAGGLALVVRDVAELAAELDRASHRGE